MTEKKLGQQTVRFSQPVYIQSAFSVVGKKEGEGPLREYFDLILSDDMFGEKTWEKAECKMSMEASTKAMNLAGVQKEEIDLYFGGDLLNQIIASSFSARMLKIPFFGLYGACSTMSESLCLGAMAIDGGYASQVIAATSSHFCSAERQFRYPLELGSQRTPTSQWTVTGSGAVVLGTKKTNIAVTHATIGRIMDFGITDANNMGAAMAPAAADTILRHFKDTGYRCEDYDLIISGDLGTIGKEITTEMVLEGGIDIREVYKDCGVEIFDRNRQDVHAGGSGCGCSATVFCGYVYKQLLASRFKKIMLVSTGALMSPISTLQGESIPGIAHAITIERSDQLGLF